MTVSVRDPKTNTLLLRYKLKMGKASAFKLMEYGPAFRSAAFNEGFIIDPANKGRWVPF